MEAYRGKKNPSKRNGRSYAPNFLVLGSYFVLFSSFLLISTHAQQSWRDKATIDRFRFPQCVENRTWPQLASIYSSDTMISGGLGNLSSEAFRVWACFAYHPCLALLPHKQGDMMCYVFHEEENHWYPWHLKSELACPSPQDQFNSNSISDLVAWYKFEGNSTDMLLDYSGNKHHIINSGASFDGQDFKEGNGSMKLDFQTYANFPSALNLSAIWSSSSEGMTFSFWAKVYPSSAHWTRLFEFGSKDESTGVIIYRAGDYSKWRFGISSPSDTSGSGFFEMSEPAIDGLWHHYAWTISPYGNWSIYFDNKHINADDQSQRATIPTDGIWECQYLGKAIDFRSFADPNLGWMDGNIDDFRIYKRALSAAEVSVLYNKL